MDQSVESEGMSQNPGQGLESDVTDDSTDGGNGQNWKGQFEDLNARYDLLNDTVAELRDAIVQSRRSQASAAVPQYDDLDDDSELTPSKVKRIVSDSIGRAVAQSTQVNDRQKWDDKAKADFPLSDPKFLREFKKEWNDMTGGGGLDPNHPKAIYQVAKVVAKGWAKPQANRSTSSDSHTSEAPTNSPVASSGNTSKIKIDDNDKQLRFYLMKGDRTKSQIENFKAKLAAKRELENKRGRR